MQFHTNIDCAKRFMSKLTDAAASSNFLVGDVIEVFKETSTSVQMTIVRRTWKKGESESLSLHVELGLASQFVNITAFENFLKSRGLPIH